MTIVGTYDPRLIALSFVVAAISAYTSLDLTGRVAAPHGRIRAFWLTGGAAAMGLGIWSMHFIGMLAFRLPMPIDYALAGVALSLLVAIAASGFALFVSGRPGLRWLIVGGTSMGLAIASMHYIGMAGMQVAAVIQYDPMLVALSILIAIVASVTALWIAFHLRTQDGASRRPLMIGAALVMGGAVCGMHYTGTSAVTFVTADHSVAGPVLGADTSWLGAAAVSTAFIVLGFALVSALVGRRLIARRTEALQREVAARDRLAAFLEAVLENTADGVVACDAEGKLAYFNRATRDLHGLPEAPLPPQEWSKHYSLYRSDGKILMAQEEVPLFKALKNGDVRDQEMVVAPTVGEPRFLLANGRRMEDAAGASLGAVVVMHDITERRRSEALGSALSSVGQRLSSISSPVSAARIIADVSNELFGWDAWALLMSSPEDGMLHQVLNFDLLDGRRTEIPDDGFATSPTPLTHRVMAGEPVLLLPEASSTRLDGLRSFGDTDRPSASLMFVPIRTSQETIGTLTIQSYTHAAYSDADLRTLQLLADHCGGALERIRTEGELRRSEGALAEAQRIAHVGSWEWDLATDEIRWSDETYRIFGFSPRQFVPNYQRFLNFVHPEDRGRVVASSDESRLSSKGFDVEFRVVRPDGQVRVVHEMGELSYDDKGRPVSLVGTTLEITERKAHEEQLRHQAFHDPLTGLPNRALFADRLEHALLRKTRRQGSVAVLYIDTDRFKFVNDSLGHEAGDELLVAIAQRLRSCLRPEDTAARPGGDEFTVLLEDVEGVRETEQMAERITDALRDSFDVAGHEVVVSFSIGIALSHDGQRDPAELLRAADTAMFRAKQTGKARYEVYDAEMGSRALELLEMESDLRRAVERDELVLHYQPKVEIGAGALSGVEALVRWEHPSRGMVSPLDFIGLAEETGLILPIGRWVMREACRQARVWQGRHPSDPLLEMCVNVSARQFAHPGLVSEVADVLQDTGLDPRSLVLEITESAVMEDAERNVATFLELKSLGVRLAIDDFGTGYSSLAYLHRFPVDMLKIDRSFVDGLGRESEDTAIVRTVIGLANALHLQVVAEGVETQDQAARLSALGCKLAQGFLFSKPLPSEGVDALLADIVRVGVEGGRRSAMIGGSSPSGSRRRTISLDGVRLTPHPLDSESPSPSVSQRVDR